MKLKLFVFVLLTVNFLSHGQLTVDWVNSTGGVDSDFAYELRVDSNDNVFVAGQFRGAVSFDPNSNNFDFTSGQYGDVFVQKFDSNGNFLWTKVFLSSDTSEKPNMTIDNNDNIYIASTFLGDIDLDPGINEDVHTNGNNLENTYIVKLSNNGDYIWGNAFEINSSNQFVNSNEIAIDNNGNVLLTGEFQSTVDFDFSNNVTSITGTGVPDSFLLKIDNNGNFVWVKQFSGNSTSTTNFNFNCLAFDSQNNILVGGSYIGNSLTDFDPSTEVFNLPAPFYYDLFVLKLTESGDFIWVKTAEGSTDTNITSYDTVNSIVIDDSDNILLVGTFKNSINFDTNSTSFILDSGINGCDNCPGSTTGYIAKMDINGDMIWTKKIDGSNYSTIDSGGNSSNILDFNENQDLYFSYAFYGDVEYEIDGQPYSYTGTNNWEVFLFQINSDNGDYISANKISNENTTFLGDMVFKDDDLYVTGTYSEELFFDSNTSITATNSPNSSAFDVYTAKYQDVILLSVNEFELYNVNVYPNPTTDKLTILSKAGMSKISIIDINGRLLNTVEGLNLTQEITLDVDSLSNGIYFLNIQSDNSDEVIQFIKD